jgi:glucokinase
LISDCKNGKTGTTFTITPGQQMSNKQQLGAIGLDIGGTKIAAGVVLWPSGEIRSRTVIPTKPTRGGEAVLKDVLDLAQQLKDAARDERIQVAGIGAGVAELVDCEGNVTSSCTIHWSGVPVQERLAEIAPAVVESDVRAAAVAEATFGAGRNSRLFIYVTVGTGISYCLMQDGRPFKGANGNAITMASSPLSTVCTHCGVKLRPVLEEFASGPAVARRFAEAKKTGTGVCEDVFRAASAGDRNAADILTSAGEALGVSTAFLVNVLDPEMVVVGGGLGLAGGLYWDSFERSCREHIFADNARVLPVVQASMGIDAGLIGAAATVFLQQQTNKGNKIYGTVVKHTGTD